MDATIKDYQFEQDGFNVTSEMKSAYEEDGCILVRNLLSGSELKKVESALLHEKSLVGRAWDLDDGEGKFSRMVLWNHPGNDITGMVARCEKVAGTCEQLLGGEVYHYHTKLMMKEPRTGGKHLWHQDYGYWYKNGCLRPDLMTVFIAIDKCVKANGCLQVLKGTHRCGRIDHDLVAGQTRANQERVDQLSKQFPLVYCEMNPGDAIFFHSNLLHTSDQNHSDLRRYAFLCAYNRADNDPVYKHHHPQYTPLAKVPNSEIEECSSFDMTGKDFMDPSSDQTIKATLKETGFH